MVDPGGEDRVGAGGIGSDGMRESGRCWVGSTPGIGSGSAIGSGMIRSVEIERDTHRVRLNRRRRRRTFNTSHVVVLLVVFKVQTNNFVARAIMTNQCTKSIFFFFNYI